MNRASAKAAVRLESRKAQLALRWVRQCQRMLTEAGVPENVLLAGETVPGNTIVCRLAWYLLRRKDVASWERDGLDKEMKLLEQKARLWESFGGKA